MTYAAFLRGINVGGKNAVAMAALKTRLERLGFRDMVTYINSGNIVFTAAAADPRDLERKIDRVLARDFGVPGKTVVRTHAEMARLVKTIGRTWRLKPAWRYNVIFLRHSIDKPKVLDGMAPKPDIEHVTYCTGTLLWCARLNALTRTTMLKLASRPIYQDMTVRSVNTTRKVFDLMARAPHSKKAVGGA
jgi:uncharacterized protein (DUF1697 family)